MRRPANENSSSAQPRPGAPRGGSRLRARPLAWLFLLFFFLPGYRAEARPGATIELSNGTLPIVRLLVGEDLWVGLRAALPGETYELRVVSPDGFWLAAEQTTTDAAGTAAPRLMWLRTGVVGCDFCLTADPSLYQYETFPEAELALDGMPLSIEVWTLGGQLVASASLPIEALPREIVYTSNHAGCPRQVFNAGEPIYLTFLHVDRSSGTRRILLPFAQPAWPVGRSLIDARGGRQLVTLPPTGDKVTLPLEGTDLLEGGRYDVFSRREAVDFPIRIATDQLFVDRIACDKRIRGGLVINPDDCTNCAPTYP